MFCGVSVAEKRSEVGLVVLEVDIGIVYQFGIVVGKDGSPLVYYLFPFRFVAQDDAGGVAEVGLFLYPAAVGEYQMGSLFESNHLQIAGRGDNA